MGCFSSRGSWIREIPPKNRCGVVFTRSAGMLLVGWIWVIHASTSLASGGDVPPVAPPPADVPPVVRSVYTADVNRNRVDDALEGLARNKTASARSFQATSDAPGKVEVDLTFSKPVTQAQIDAFLALGGEIDYIYKAVSYGWQGRIVAEKVAMLPEAMGSTLVQVAPDYEVQLYMDIASQTGRVRPVWQPGFGGRVDGFDGDPNTTIAFVDSGLDDMHPDLAGRGVYWIDVSTDRDPTPVDYGGHGSAVVGVAVGTGQAGGAETSDFRYTHTARWPDWSHYAGPIVLPPGPVTVTSRAYWKGASARLEHVLWRRGTDMKSLRWQGDGQPGDSPVFYTSTIDTSDRYVFSAVLADWTYSALSEAVIVSTVSDYPGLGDGYNKFRGVAPGCKWAAAKFYGKDGSGWNSGLSRSIDDLVSHRVENNIKIVNFSSGILAGGIPARSEQARDRVLSAIRNGVIVVVAAGNGAGYEAEAYRAMSDPAVADLAITVGAVNDENQLTTYSTYGFTNPHPEESEGFKPDLLAPGGSYYHTGIASVDTGSYDVYPNEDREPNDYVNATGTSLACPFVAGCAALVIDALTQQGLQWDFFSDEHPRLVKMLLCATATETHVNRENDLFNPTLERASEGPEGFPPGKDRYEGYGIVNPDAAVEAVSLLYTPGEFATGELGAGRADRRAWARRVDLLAGEAFDVFLGNPPEGDFDLYLYSAVPDQSGEPVLLAWSTNDTPGASESIAYTPETDQSALLVVKRVSGAGEFGLSPAYLPPLTEEEGQ